MPWFSWCFRRFYWSSFQELGLRFHNCTWFQSPAQIGIFQSAFRTRKWLHWKAVSQMRKMNWRWKLFKFCGSGKDGLPRRDHRGCGWRSEWMHRTPFHPENHHITGVNVMHYPTRVQTRVNTAHVNLILPASNHGIRKRQNYCNLVIGILKDRMMKIWEHLIDFNRFFYQVSHVQMAVQPLHLHDYSLALGWLQTRQGWKEECSAPPRPSLRH